MLPEDRQLVRECMTDRLSTLGNISTGLLAQGNGRLVMVLRWIISQWFIAYRQGGAINYLNDANRVTTGICSN